MEDRAYLIAFRAKSMETKPRMVEWLRERGAVHVLADVCLLETHHPMAGDITLDVTLFEAFDGELFVVGLHRNTAGWAGVSLSENAIAWLKENLD
jgi:hypothetical protein